MTADIRTNALFFGLFLFIHFALVASYGIFRSTKFSKGSIKEQAMYLLSTFSLPLPFLTIKGIDRGEEKYELWFLVVLHSLENFLLIVASRLVHMQSSYPLGIIVFDLILVLVNILAVLVSVLYVKKLELYAGLPRDLPSSLPYGLEVSFRFELLMMFLLFFQVNPHSIGKSGDLVDKRMINQEEKILQVRELSVKVIHYSH